METASSPHDFKLMLAAGGQRASGIEQVIGNGNGRRRRPDAPGDQREPGRPGRSSIGVLLLLGAGLVFDHAKGDEREPDGPETAVDVLDCVDVAACSHRRRDRRRDREPPDGTTLAERRPATVTPATALPPTGSRRRCRLGGARSARPSRRGPGLPPRVVAGLERGGKRSCC